MENQFRNTLLPILRFALIMAAGVLVLATGAAFGYILGNRNNNVDVPDFVATLMAMTPEITPVEPTATATASETPTSTPEPTPTATATEIPTATYTPTAVPTPVPPDWVVFVQDMTIPDGTALVGGETFIKIWRLRNAGSRAWTVDYDLIFLSGDRMSGAAAIALPHTVKPGEMVDIAVRLTAPPSPGTYHGNWMLRNASGGIFGVGDEANRPFWVDIRVEDPSRIVYDFAAHYCDGVWTSGAGVLPCPGEAGDLEGLVASHGAPVMEGDITVPGPTLAVAPQQVRQGWITGSFPSFIIGSGDQFRASIACMNNSTNCNMQFRLDYRIGTGQIRTLASWQEAHEGWSRTINLSLASLRGKEVTFMLSVSAGENYLGDNGLWIRPRIVR